MAITPLPSLDRTSVTFKTDVDTFFGSQLPTFSIEAEAARADVVAKQAIASTAATTATTQATNASTSATNSATSKTGADTANTAAQAAKTAAEAALDSFDDRYLGAKAAAPTLDNDGAALLTGALYWDTVLNGGCLRVWQGAWATIPANVATAVSTTPAGSLVAINVQASLAELDLKKSPIASSLFSKTDTSTVAFTKTAAGTVSVKAGTAVEVFGVRVAWAADTAITMPALTGGNDYAIYVCTDGSIRADASTSAPTGYSTANSRKIGGFHYGLVAAATTVAGGSFATTGNGMIWTQGAVDDIAGINKYSLWDLKFRPACSDPRGMVLVGGRTWVDVYMCSTDTATNGTSKASSNIASGTVLPKIPAAFGGNGTTTYPSLNWWVANELARANQKRMMWEHEFVDAAYGVTENQTIDATASTYPTTQRNAGYTSKYGIEQASGHHWTWGLDSNFFSEAASPAGSWKTVNGNTGAAGSDRGQTYTFGAQGLSRVLLGGSRTYGALSGSRASNWSYVPWNSNWTFGLRAACDHMQLV